MRKSTVDLMLLAVVLIWGANYTIAKFGMASLSAEVFTLTRFLLVIPVLALLVWYKEKQLGIDKQDIPAFLLASLVGIALYQTLFVASLRYTSASNASLLIAMSPLFTVLGSVMARKERVTLPLLAGSLLCVLGVVLIKGMGEQGLTFSLDSMWGDIIAGVASLLFGLYPFTTTRLSQKYSAVKLTLYTSIFGSVFLGIYSGADWLQVSWSELPGAAWGSILFAAYPVTAYSLVAWNYGMEKLGSSRVMPYMYLVPAAAIVVAMLWIDEKMNGWQWLGAALILGGVFLVRQGNMLLARLKKQGESAPSPNQPTTRIQEIQQEKI
ncbi:DMT family transporter [Brevibacillus dissolubilis]|uniref:DMT family transporter n=1 Tax=Brevibacillus dissolubilis TaxID=1844116 RepID=UPI00159B9F7B|nr:DMT family transporter [Brevibacillus dissolubilis]